jgi:DNA-binding Lrp family transcriptional regulator
MVMKFNKNEKRVLKHLLANARATDSAIAKKLRISSQAVGKIRKKLESSVIESYSINLNYAKLGIQTFVIALAKLTHDGMDKGELEVEKRLSDDPNVIEVFRLPNQSTTHVILYGFKDMNDLDSFFHSTKKKQELHHYIENRETFTFSHNSRIKSDPRQLFQKVIDEADSETPLRFIEFENYKRRLERKQEPRQ